MGKPPDNPDTWGILEDQANKVREALSKKSIRPEVELADALEEMARDIALIEPDPKDWGGWVNYFIEQLEAEAMRIETIIEIMLTDIGIHNQRGLFLKRKES